MREGWATALQDAGVRVTRPRAALVDLISERDEHFTIGEIEEAAQALRPTVGRATVFRTVELLRELGLLERLDLPTGEHAYVACRAKHHHHVVCSKCGQSAAVGEQGLKNVMRAIGRRTGYRIDSHRLEVYGLCPGCRGKRASPAQR